MYGTECLDTFDAIRSFLEPVVRVTVKDLVASVRLQDLLTYQCSTIGEKLLMHGFIGRRKAIMNESPPVPSVGQPSERTFLSLLFFILFLRRIEAL